MLSLFAARFVAVAALLLLVITLLPPATGTTPETRPDADSELVDQVSLLAVMYDYRNYSEMKSALQVIQNDHSDIARIYDIGDSWEKTQGIADRDILAMKISDNVLMNEDEPEALIVALHHAREWPTSELVVALAENITDAYGSDPRKSWLVDNRETWLVPIVNPDGLDYALASDQWWRKNRRLNYDGTYGVDLNRNYAGSMNSDSAGDWGGAGTSHSPGNDIYCGESPFSEPETQAIRDLVLGHDFEVLLDFHSYGQWVMWPWGYNTNLTPDNDDLVRMGNEFAALNGYTPMQSVDLYPTTGDSIDWEYGGADVYAFCFEVGNEFHPAKTADVMTIIQNNIPPSLLGIELAGDREERGFQIVHAPVSERNFSSQGFDVIATIAADRGVDSSALDLLYSVDEGLWTRTAMVKVIGNDTYSANIPSQSIGAVVRYYIVAQDVSGVQLMSPRYAPYDVYSFLVAPPAGPPIEIVYAPPSILDGSAVSTVNASARNLSLGASLVLHLQSSSSGAYVNLTMTETSPENYSCVIPSGLPLGDYDVWLASEVGGVPEWSSTVSTTRVTDLTAPAIGTHSAEQTESNSLDLVLNCSDLYGVVEVLVLYRVGHSGSIETASMILASGNARAGNWTATLTIDGANEVEYKFEAYDSVGYSQSPEDGGMFAFVPIVEVQLWAVALVLVAVAVLVVLVSRARRA